MSQPRSRPDETLYGRYKLVRELGCGGMGIVHQAHDLRARRDVAIKRAHRDDRGFLERFRREYKALAAIQHRGVPAIYDVGDTTKGEAYFTMELVRGETLADHMRSHRRLDPVRAVTLAIELGRVLMAVHEVGIIHRDVKPNNIILEPGDRVRLLDFGVCAMTDDYYRRQPLTVVGQRWQSGDMEFVGNPAYTDPEHFSEGRTSPQNDVFSVCVILYELVSGRHLFSYDVMRHREILAEEFPPALAPLVAELQRGVADSVDRHRSMEELVRALEIVRTKIAGVPAAAAPPPARGRLWAGFAAALIAVAAGSFVLGRSTADTAPPPLSAAAAPSCDEGRPDVNAALPAPSVRADVEADAPHVAATVEEALSAPSVRADVEADAPHVAATVEEALAGIEAPLRACAARAGRLVTVELSASAGAERFDTVDIMTADSAVERCFRDALEPVRFAPQPSAVNLFPGYQP
jgi:serine/threonine protein kinase